MSFAFLVVKPEMGQIKIQQSSGLSGKIGFVSFHTRASDAMERASCTLGLLNPSQLVEGKETNTFTKQLATEILQGA